MINAQDITALVELLNRVPKTTAEMLYCADLVERLNLTVRVLGERKEDGNRRENDDS